MEGKNSDKISSEAGNNTAHSGLPRFENMNGLRFIGALAVFLFHSFTLGNEVWGDFYDNPTFTLFKKIILKGHFGVNLFFVLSGFLITYLLLSEAKKNSKINIKGFFMRRLLRIWPVYFIVVAFGFLILPHLPYGVQTINSPVYYSLFMSNLEEIWHGWNDSVNMLTITWSVSIEEQFYLAWVALMILIPPIRKGKFFLGYFTLLILGSLVFRYLHIGEERVLYFHTLSVISDIAIGGYLSYICFKTNLLKSIASFPKLAVIFIYVLGISAIIGTRVIFQGDLIVFERIFIGIFFAYVVFDQAFGKNSLIKVDKIPGFFKLGEISYGIYMYHCIVIYFVQSIMADLGWTSSPLNFIIYLIVCSIATIILSWLSYKYVEKPLLKLKKNFR